MKQSNANINVEGESFNIVVLPPTVKFREEWMFLFRQPLVGLSDELSTTAKAVLLDLIANGAISVYGLVMTNVSSLLLHGVSRSSVYRALGALEQLDIIARGKNGQIYLNPKLAYKGSSRDWGYAMSYWNCVRGKKEE
jgi:hypothetical protein